MRRTTLALMMVCVLLVAVTSCEQKEKEPEVTISPPAGKDYFYVPINNALHIIDGATDTIVKTIPYNDYIIGGTFSPDGRRYYANALHSIYVFDTTKQELVDTYRFSTELSKVLVGGFGVSEDNRSLYIISFIVKKKQNVPRLNVLPPQLVVFDIESKKIAKSFEIPYYFKPVFPIKNDPDHLILVGYDVCKFSLKTGKIEVIETLFNPKKGEKVRNCLPGMDAISPGDHVIVVYSYYEGEGINVSSGFLMIDRNKGQARLLPSKDLWLSETTILSPDKKYVYAVMDELIKIDAETGKTVNFVQLENGTCKGVATSSDGKKVYVGPSGPDISVYESETLKLIKVIPLEGDGGYAMHRVTL